jgi:NTE family protein
LKFWRFNLGMALSGGAARGLAHMGVIKAMEEAGISIDVITGTSMGALVGAMYATQPDIDLIFQKVKDHLDSEIFKQTKIDAVVKWNKEAKENQGFFSRIAGMISKGFIFSTSFSRLSIVSEENFINNIEALVEDIDIRETRIRFGCVALDLNTENEIMLDKGPLRQAVRASCAIPGIMPPVELGSNILVDGGWVNNIPTMPAFQMGSNMVIAVGSRESSAGSFDTVIGVFSRADTAARHALNSVGLQNADVIISPEVNDIPWYEFGMLEELFQRGLNYGRDRIPEIREARRRLRLKKFFFS